MKKPEPNLRSRLLIGAIAGIAGTLAMTAAMRRIRSSEAVPGDPPEPGAAAQDAVTAGRFVYGAASGALLGAANIMVGPIAGGTAGIGVWLAHYAGLIPGPADTEYQRPVRHTVRVIASYVVWGVATAAATRELTLGIADEYVSKKR